jgi:hypothetical protein
MEEAVKLASQCNWSHCIQTRITLTLAEGDLPESFERKGLQVVLPGRVKTFTEEVDEAKFLRCLGQWPPITPQTESEVRMKLVNSQEIEEKANGNNSSCE